jgi:hypothetical protein
LTVRVTSNGSVSTYVSSSFSSSFLQPRIDALCRWVQDLRRALLPPLLHNNRPHSPLSPRTVQHFCSRASLLNSLLPGALSFSPRRTVYSLSSLLLSIRTHLSSSLPVARPTNDQDILPVYTFSSFLAPTRRPPPFIFRCNAQTLFFPLTSRLLSHSPSELKAKKERKGKSEKERQDAIARPALLRCVAIETRTGMETTRIDEKACMRGGAEGRSGRVTTGEGYRKEREGGEREG